MQLWLRPLLLKLSLHQTPTGTLSVSPQLTSSSLGSAYIKVTPPAPTTFLACFLGIRTQLWVCAMKLPSSLQRYKKRHLLLPFRLRFFRTPACCPWDWDLYLLRRKATTTTTKSMCIFKTSKYKSTKPKHRCF